MKKIVVLFPTKSEAKLFNREDVSFRFTGVGMTAAAYMTSKCILEDKPDIIIMAGIAGVYYDSKFKKGETVIVSREHEADCGFFTKTGFEHISKGENNMDYEVISHLDCPYVNPNMPFPLASANTMNAALAPFVNTDDVDIESMEGYAFFYSCIKENVEFYELRTISNYVDPDDEWNYEDSIKNMTSSLHTLIDYLNSSPLK